MRSTEPLSVDFIPRTFPGREKLVEEIQGSLESTLKGEPAENLWIHGPPGVGKTSTIRSVLGSLEEKRLRTAYVNCWSSQTFYSVLERIFTELRALVPETRDVSFKFERLARIAKENPLVIVLDEVDQLFLKERNATLYNLCELEKATVVCLTGSRTSYMELEPRIRSRIQARFIEFNSYPQEALMQILEARATTALAPDSWCLAALRNITEAVGGDARIAIQALRTAAYLAEKARKPQIQTQDLQAGVLQSEQLKKRYVLKGLSEHHRILHQAVKEAGEIKLHELWREYRKRAELAGLEPRARRTFNHYRQYMVMSRLLEERQASGRRNVRVLKVVE